MRQPEQYLGKPVTSLQTMLRHISDFDDRILPVIPDGVYGENTYASVRSFQETYGLPETGIADAETWNAIVPIHDQALEFRMAPSLVIPWPMGRVFDDGEEHSLVFLAQAMLTAISHLFPAFPAVELSGTVDDATSIGLRQLQSAGKLPVTGALDVFTWNRLLGLYQALF